MSPWYKLLGFTQILWALVGFLSLCQKISILLEATLSYAHVLILLFFSFAFFLLLGAVFMSLSFQFFLLNSWFEYYLSFVLRFLEISVHFRNFFCKSLVNSE